MKDYCSQFGKRVMTQLDLKVKLITFYTATGDKAPLLRLRDECNTCKCQYTLIPIQVRPDETNISEAKINTHVSGYKKDFDKLCVIEPSIKFTGQYLKFDSVKDFSNWLQQYYKNRNI